MCLSFMRVCFVFCVMERTKHSARVHIFVYACVCARARARAHVRVCARMHACACMRKGASARAREHKPASKNADVYDKLSSLIYSKSISSLIYYYTHLHSSLIYFFFLSSLIYYYTHLHSYFKDTQTTPTQHPNPRIDDDQVDHTYYKYLHLIIVVIMVRAWVWVYVWGGCGF